MAALRKWADDEKVPLVDLIAAMDDDRSVLLTYVHLTPAGNRIIARELTAEIRRQLAQ